MKSFQSLRGVYAAALTPLRPDFTPDLEGVAGLLGFLAQRGCHGVLLLGTTGEGPSFSRSERAAIFRAAQKAREKLTHLQLLAGVGTPSLEDTQAITRDAFEAGMDGVVALPPYYYRKVSDDGLYEWFSLVLRGAVPADGALFGYHIPAVSGVGLSLDLLARLKDAFPQQFAGIKDSSGDAEHATQLDQRFGSDLMVFTGNDRLFSHALQSHAAGCITAMANIASPMLRRVWDGNQAGLVDTAAQAELGKLRDIMDRYPPAPPLLKALIHQHFGLPNWPVRPPLLNLTEETARAAVEALTEVLGEIQQQG